MSSDHNRRQPPETAVSAEIFGELGLKIQAETLAADTAAGVSRLGRKEIAMPASNRFDMKFRPAAYWEGPDAGFANIKGEMRRRMLKKALKTGDFMGLPDSLLSDSLSEDERLSIGRIHPAYMGGEYLPDYLPSEVEVARVSLNSVTWDVVSVRARPGADGLIHYRVVDE